MKVFRRTGSIVAFSYQKAVPKKATTFVGKLKKHRFESIDSASEEISSTGWTTPADPSGDQFDPDAIDVEGAYWIQMRTDRKRMPTKFLGHHFAVAEASRGRKLSRRERTEIREEIAPQLLERQLPTTNSIDVLVFPHERLVLLFATSASVRDSFVVLWERTFEGKLTPLYPCDLARASVAAAQLSEIDQLTPTKLPRDGQLTLGLEQTEEWLGREFLLWLWFLSEHRGGTFEIEDPKGEVAISLDELVQFAPADDNETASTLRGGTPSRTPEAREGLLRGRKLSRLRLVLALSSEVWQLTIDAERFALASVKLPEDDPDTDSEEVGFSRVDDWRRLFVVFSATFARFLAVRLNAKAWKRESEELVTWMRNRG